LAFDPAGNLYAGGTVTTAGGISANRVAKWNGTAWSALGAGFNNTCEELVIDGAGNLYAGGIFTQSGTKLLNYIAVWDGTTWDQLSGDGLDNSCTVITADSNILYVGGNFICAGGAVANGITAYTNDFVELTYTSNKMAVLTDNRKIQVVSTHYSSGGVVFATQDIL
jgi:hypothetical protein